MRSTGWRRKATTALAAAVVIITAAVLLGLRFGAEVGLLAVLALAGWAAVVMMLMQRRAEHRQVENNMRHVQQNLDIETGLRAEARRRLDITLRINHALAEMQDEEDLMASVLSSINDLAGALGSSFVPIDEWRQPLPPFTHGQLPEPVLQAWSLHLASGMLRERCGNCRTLHSHAGGCPLHPQEVGGALQVICLPMERSATKTSAGLPLGVLHLYFAPDCSLDDDLRSFLTNLLPEIATAYENAHLRAQEMTTLRQVQLVHISESDFSSSLSNLLDGVREALTVDCAMVQLRKSSDERLSNLTITRGEPCRLDQSLEAIFARIAAGELTASPASSLPVWLALPLRLPAGTVLGFLLVSSAVPRSFHARQRAILQMVAGQVALLVENERLLRTLEYKLIVEERTRLAREIHDGLAQTLAFLKIHSSQMQNSLAQGDLERLSRLLKENHQALADAYLDTRQSIDNLRLTPQEGLAAWIERVLRDFAQVTGTSVERRLDPLALGRAASIAPEIQAQLIRIVQESLSNVRKHAQAQNVLVSLRLWRQDLILEITDDGVGFDADDVPEISRHGLRGMRERAELVGAEFQVVSQTQKGTTVRLTIPMLAEETA